MEFNFKFTEDGLIPVIVQEATATPLPTGRVLMFAWMNRESLLETLSCGNAVYWSRSRKRLWRKGEESGHEQIVHGLRTDCDGDVVLLLVEQVGGIACHTGRQSCFFYALTDKGWNAVEPVLRDPKEMYR